MERYSPNGNKQKEKVFLKNFELIIHENGQMTNDFNDGNDYWMFKFKKLQQKFEFWKY